MLIPLPQFIWLVRAMSLPLMGHKCLSTSFPSAIHMYSYPSVCLVTGHIRGRDGITPSLLFVLVRSMSPSFDCAERRAFVQKQRRIAVAALVVCVALLEGGLHPVSALPPAHSILFHGGRSPFLL